MHPTIRKTNAEQFGQRFITALRKHKVPINAAAVTAQFNARAGSLRVTSHAVRKWLMGESVPLTNRLVILASWLGVSPQWLAHGDDAPGWSPDAMGIDPRPLDPQLLERLGKLSGDEKDVIRKLVTILKLRQDARASASVSRSF